MPENEEEQIKAKAWAFFERARKVAETGNFDYAINMYLEGLKCDPEALKDGHIPLYEMGQKRAEKKGKKPTMVERVKRLGGKTNLDKMLNAEYLLAKDPGHLAYAEAMLKAAAAGGYKRTGKWIADLIFQANNLVKKPSLQTYLLLKDSYAAIGEFDRAIAACQCAVKAKPQDGALADELKNLAAELAVSRGKYDQEGDFRQSIKDKEAQDRLHAQEGVVKTEDYRASAVQRARQAYAKEPNLPRTIFNLGKALSESQEDEGENEAIELLRKAYKDKSDFSFEQRAGEIKIKQLKRKMRKAKDTLEANPEDEQAKAELAELAEQRKGVELEHYRLCVQNYPTDLQVRYEYAVRLLHNKQYDEAIPLFQESQKDPRRKISSMGKIGLCFYQKGWYTDAIDVFTQAMDLYEIKDDSIAKELRYDLARSYEKKADTEKALEIYRKIAQLDFGYKDVRARVDKLRGTENAE